ncbi:ATP-binding protein [Paenibacillus doosanensis]|uniref:ATPase YjoB n=1 Tax=Paenibacillus konkukensis TaxID=2020716 RepID=A0ABY4RWJ9_9BACL|nr:MULTISPECIES: ATP-binding protein [Paenibacillus]MCS7463902.1 ATP-binding protein [Paenibacillus doosanensis]UQZ85769.1 putative ATPase YjoB [Paenibacillus konkukensis]
MIPIRTGSPARGAMQTGGLRTASASLVSHRTPHSAPPHHDAALAIERIQSMLTERFGAEFQMYVQDDYGNEMWEMLEEDIRSGSEAAEHMASIYDSVEAKSFSYRGEQAEAGYRIFASIRNNVFLYPAYRVALARVPVFRQHGIFDEEYIFAADDDCMDRFLAYMLLRQRENDREHVTVMTDGPNGLERSQEPITRAVGRDEVMMDDRVKQEIYRSIDEFFSRDRQFFTSYDIPYKRGILLYGRPGNGKTTLVKSIAGSARAPVAYWQITEHTCSQSIQDVFESAQKMAPMVLVIEDIDSMPGLVRSFFLNTLDGATSKEGIFLIGTTNYPENIDPALMNRAGRFDRAYEIRLPDAALRRRYLERKRLELVAGDGAAERAAALTEGFSFAQLNELYASAALQKHYEQEVKLEALIQNMKAELNKARTQQWVAEQAGARMGFGAG